jgi:hypothetical protein
MIEEHFNVFSCNKKRNAQKKNNVFERNGLILDLGPPATKALLGYSVQAPFLGNSPNCSKSNESYKNQCLQDF